MSALPLVNQEPETTAWFALRMSPNVFGIFDAVPHLRMQGRDDIIAMVDGGHQSLIREGCGHVLTVHRFVVEAKGPRRQLLAHASFTAAGALDPEQTGVSLEVRAKDGSVLYEAAVPGWAFQANRSRRVFRYMVRPGQQPIATANGLQRVTIRLDKDVADVFAAGTSPDVNAVAAEPALYFRDAFGRCCRRDQTGSIVE